MSTDYRALLLELIEAWESYCYADAGDATDRMTEAVKEARAALAQPEPVGPSEEELDELFIEIDQSGESQSWRAYARAVLKCWGRPTPQPIPVSERLPGAEDCDAEGRCWYFSFETVIGGANWQLFTEEEQEGFVPPTHWLPAHALPLPSGDHHLNAD